MKGFDKFSKFHVKRYCQLISFAVKHGVPMDDIIMETRKYHGTEFTDLVEKEINRLT